MKKRLTFDVAIDAEREKVWETMLGAETYGKWTVAFCEGTYYDGSWEKGSSIKFLAPSGDGIIAEIAENRQYEYVSIRHLGQIAGGVEDTSSESVQTWAPAYENFIFEETDRGTRVTVELDTLADYEQSISDTYPKALGILKELCESE